MKKLNLNEKGFTLIELLAVIVILAIVMVLASQSVLPFMRNASKDSFVIEANGVIDAASNAISLYNVGQLDLTYEKDKDNNDIINKEKFTKTVEGGKTTGYCFTLQYLVDEGLYSLKANKIDKNNYGGYVEAKKEGNSFTYTLNFRNKDFYVEKFNSGAVSADNVKELDATGKAIATQCP